MKLQVVGALDRFIPLSRRTRMGVDAALATFSDAVTDFLPWHYAGIGDIGTEPVEDRFALSRVIKRGNTTGVTRGTVSAFELDGITVDYGTRKRPLVVTFDDQLEFVGDPPRRAFSQGGDSGSFIIDADTLAPAALLYAGGPDADGIDRTLGHFMPQVLKSLNVWLVQP